MGSKVKVVAKALKGAALGIIDAYLKINPQASLADLNKAFESSEIKGGKQLLFTEAELDKEVAESGSSSAAEKLADRKKQGYFVTMPDGTKISFSARLMWNKDNYPILESIANKLGIEVASFDSWPAGAKGFYIIENSNGETSSSVDSDAAAKAKAEAAAAKAAAEKAKAEAAAAEKAKAEIEKAAIEKAKADAAKAKAEAEAAAAAKASAEVAKAKAEVERLKAEAEMAKAEAAALAKAKAEIDAAKAEAEKAKAAADKAKSEADKAKANASASLDGVEYVDLDLPSGLKWAKMNLGATKPEEAGWYIAWGELRRRADYSVMSSLTSKKDSSQLKSKRIINNKGNLTAAHDVASKVCGGKWRMPTKADFDELLVYCTWEWTTLNGVNGYKVKSNKPGNDNWIFLPAAGYRSGNSNSYVGSDGNYWSSTVDESNNLYACYLYFRSGCKRTGNDIRDFGHSVRPVTE